MGPPTMNGCGGRPSVHLWIFNHPFHGISDQIEYFITVFKQQGYPVSVGRRPHRDSLNVVIENFSEDSRDVVIDFCRSTQKRLAVIMTEHLDFSEGQILIHGDVLWSTNDYMAPRIQVDRIKNLMILVPFIKAFLVLGDLPRLQNVSEIMPGIGVHSIPLPRLDRVASELSALVEPAYDLFFSGVVTEHRSIMLTALGTAGLDVDCPRGFVSRKRRDQLNRASKVVLNIPQRTTWRWLSLMRIIAALRSGRATVSLGTDDSSEIAKCTYQVSLDNPGWLPELKQQVSQWRDLYELAYADYCDMAAAFEAANPFPHLMLECWAVTDGLLMQETV